ncbi:TIM barrel protein [Candidatus Micrarchaeota archaeon]|nr:TIM barrel protein [Candidatus Micrarchaeota archaeon]
MVLNFGPAGIPLDCPQRSTLEGVRYSAKIGLRAMECEFVRGVRMSEAEARIVGAEAARLGVSLSAHAPYYINCCPTDKSKEATAERNLLATAKIASALGVKTIVFHPGYRMGRDSPTCLKQAKVLLEQVLEKMRELKIKSVLLGLETVGKHAQFGNLSENCELSKALGEENTVPVVDFAHVHATREGGLKTKNDFKKIFDELERSFSSSYVKRFHSHFSEIEFSEKGERYHLPLHSKDSPPITPLLQVIKENNYAGTIICETPELERDALKMQEEWKRM